MHLALRRVAVAGSVRRCFLHSSPSLAKAIETKFDLPDPQHLNSASDGFGGDSWAPRLTKIVATIGPTSEQLPVLQKVVEAGMRIMRLNFSHATVEEVELRTKNLKLCQVRLHCEERFKLS